MRAGIKERNRYADISWLMPSVDTDAVFDKLGIHIEDRPGHEIRALCPDHHLFVGRASSDPNWQLNTLTGKTFCFTEGRGSNLVWTVCRLLRCGPDDAAKFLAGKTTDAEMEGLRLGAVQLKQKRIRENGKDEKKEEIKGLDAILKDIQNRKMSDEAYQFFIHPPGKKYPTNITRETVDRYNIFERTWGFYANRVVIPYFMYQKVVGFCAIDLMGKEAWMEAHPALPEKDYRKVRYPENFNSSECLFGFDDVPKGVDTLIVTEGAREVMKLTQEGFHAVAILGAYLSKKHRVLFGELAPQRIVLMFDGDNAGVAITTRVANDIKGMFSGDRLLKCFLPKGRDPKTLDRNDLKRVLERAKKPVDAQLMVC